VLLVPGLLCVVTATALLPDQCRVFDVIPLHQFVSPRHVSPRHAVTRLPTTKSMNQQVCFFGSNSLLFICFKSCVVIIFFSAKQAVTVDKVVPSTPPPPPAAASVQKERVPVHIIFPKSRVPVGGKTFFLQGIPMTLIINFLLLLVVIQLGVRAQGTIDLNSISRQRMRKMRSSRRLLQCPLTPPQR
jgi:hypothetical protein